MTILVTGTAGFIGSALAKALLEKGDNVIGIDNHNNYYDPALKEARIKKLSGQESYKHLRADITNSEELEEIFKKYKPKKVVNLAAQAGVQYSLKYPMKYIESNIIGFTNILEQCRYNNIEHLVYASTSSVYGANTNLPFSPNQPVSHPLSFYAATKRANELMAHTYSYLYDLPTTGLRFFTVYGPWGRPDMALFKFTKSIINDEPIDVFNNGNHTRDFTYVDDIVKGIMLVLDSSPQSDKNWDGKNPNQSTSKCPWRIYNIGNNDPVNLMDYINAIEKELGKKAKINYKPLQVGDVPDTNADVSDLVNDLGYEPKVKVDEGIKRFISWYLEYYS